MDQDASVSLERAPFASLAGRFALGADDRTELARLVRAHRVAARGAIIAAEGDRPERVRFVLSGLAVCYRESPDGKRRIIGLTSVGDLIDPAYLFFSQCDHTVAAVSRLELADITLSDLEALMGRRPAIAKAVMIDSLRRTSITQQWLANIDGHAARARAAHLFCELAIRIGCDDGAGGVSYDLPMTQAQLAEMLGLTLVHMNRVLKDLAAGGLIRRDKTIIRIPSIKALEADAGFSARYLHLDLSVRDRRKVPRPAALGPSSRDRSDGRP